MKDQNLEGLFKDKLNNGLSSHLLLDEQFILIEPAHLPFRLGKQNQSLFP